jgi:hypothetical protein
MKYSKQRNLAQAAFNSDFKGVEERIIAAANLVLSKPDSFKDGLWSQFAFNHALNDGAFYPFTDGVTPECKKYDAKMGELGNESDENDFIALIWIMTLSKTGDPKYINLIAKIADIAVNGL